MQGKSCTRIPSPHGRTARSREPHSAGRKRGLGSPSAAVGGERRERGRFADSRAAVPRIPNYPFSASPSSTTGSLYSPRAESAPREIPDEGMAGPAASAVPLHAGSTPLPRRNPAAVRGLMRPPLLMVAKAQPCVLRRFTPASRRKCVAARGHGRQELRAGQYQLDDDEPLWLAVVRDITWGLRSFLAFLAEQPRQLKHLEWPGFRNTQGIFAYCWSLID
ncbi:hypothetical protein DAI22_09g120900 [Oryza sativa Japonica Group]|nr:hypothetical protein DAI22_09g120900 [Oryza sativa Japonica Group]